MKHVIVACPLCRKSLKVPAEATGKKVTCPACSSPFILPGIVAKPLPVEGNSYGVRDEDEPVRMAKPVKRRPRPDDDDSREHQPNYRRRSFVPLIIAGGVASFVLLGVVAAVLLLKGTGQGQSVASSAPASSLPAASAALPKSEPKQANPSGPTWGAVLAYAERKAKLTIAACDLEGLMIREAFAKKQAIVVGGLGTDRIKHEIALQQLHQLGVKNCPQELIDDAMVIAPITVTKMLEVAYPDRIPKLLTAEVVFTRFPKLMPVNEEREFEKHAEAKHLALAMKARAVFDGTDEKRASLLSHTRLQIAAVDYFGFGRAIESGLGNSRALERYKHWYENRRNVGKIESLESEGQLLLRTWAALGVLADKAHEKFLTSLTSNHDAKADNAIIAKAMASLEGHNPPMKPKSEK